MPRIHMPIELTFEEIVLRAYGFRSNFNLQGPLCTNLFSNGTAVEVWEWISNFTPHYVMHVITYPCWD